MPWNLDRSLQYCAPSSGICEVTSNDTPADAERPTRPLPVPTPETAAFWNGARQGRLIIQRCTDCANAYFPPRPFCPACGSRAVDEEVASGRATLYSYVINQRPPPGFDAERFEGEIGTCLRAVSGDVSVETVLARDGFATADRSTFDELLGSYPSADTDLDFWTEAAMLSAVGIDAVVIGPGDIAVAHAADEHVSAADLEWAVAMFTSMLAVV